MPLLLQMPPLPAAIPPDHGYAQPQMSQPLQICLRGLEFLPGFSNLFSGIGDLIVQFGLYLFLVQNLRFQAQLLFFQLSHLGRSFLLLELQHGRCAGDRHND